MHGNIASKTKYSNCDYSVLSAEIANACSAVSSTSAYPFPIKDIPPTQNPITVNQNSRWHGSLLDPVSEYLQISNFHVYFAEMLTNNTDIVMSAYSLEKLRFVADANTVFRIASKTLQKNATSLELWKMYFELISVAQLIPPTKRASIGQSENYLSVGEYQALALQ